MASLIRTPFNFMKRYIPCIYRLSFIENICLLGGSAIPGNALEPAFTQRCPEWPWNERQYNDEGKAKEDQAQLMFLCI